MVLFAVSMSLASIIVLYFALSDAADKEADVMVRLPIDKRGNEILDNLEEALRNPAIDEQTKRDLVKAVKYELGA